MSLPLDSMLEALQIEIAAIKKKGGCTRVQLHRGMKIGQSGEFTRYKFYLAEPKPLPDDTPVKIIVDQETIPGTLESFIEGVLIIALEGDLGDKILHATLITDDSFLLERLSERLTDVKSGSAQFNHNAANRAFCLKPPRSGEAEIPSNVKAPSRFNQEKLKAVRQALGSDTLFLWGPPGTGKTTTLAMIVEAHYRLGNSVLLVSNTNIAVDTALEMVAERLEDDVDFHQGLVIRHGPVVKPELLDKYGDQVVLDKVVERLGARLAEEKKLLESEREPLTLKEKALSDQIAVMREVEEVNHNIEVITSQLNESMKKIEWHRLESKGYMQNYDAIQAKLERARSMGKLQRIFKGLNIEKLEKERTEAYSQSQARSDAADRLSSSCDENRKQIAAMQQRMRELQNKSISRQSASQLRKQLGDIQSQLAQINLRIRSINTELQELKKSVIERCRILATTVYRTYLGKDTDRQFDVVIVDEASMLIPPLVYYAAGLSKNSVTVAGDFRQLSPIVMSGEPAALKWLKRDVFEIARIPEAIRRNQSVPYLASLREQFRMKEPICDVINQLFYENHLITSETVNQRNEQKLPQTNASLLYIDTAGYHPWASYKLGSYSRYNLLHAMMIRNLILQLNDEDALPEEGEANEIVGIVSPYAAQARLIQSMLDEELNERLKGASATVHRFQGNQKDIMIFDLTDSFGVRLGGFLKAEEINEDGARLINVAVSRAKSQVILIVNLEYMLKRAPQKGYTRRMIDHFIKHGTRIELDDLTPITGEDWTEGIGRVWENLIDIKLSNSMMFNEVSFYPAFVQDILAATESIVIFSPFVTTRGVSRWMDLFQEALNRDVGIRIVSKPPEEFGGGTSEEVWDLTHMLRQTGITVDLRSKMHEKIAVIDSKVLWLGSLNILSHNDTLECMTRFEGLSTCSVLGQYISTPVLRKEKEKSWKLVERENPDCPKCNHPTVWNTGRYGIYFTCEESNCNGKVNPDDKRTESGSRSTGENTPPLSSHPRVGRACPQQGCNGHLELCSGRYGQFLGCSKFPRCKYTENIK